MVLHQVTFKMAFKIVLILMNAVHKLSVIKMRIATMNPPDLAVNVELDMQEMVIHVILY